MSLSTFVYPHPHVRLVSVSMGEQSNILILLLQELTPLVPSSYPLLLMWSLLIIGLLKMKLRGIRGLLRGAVRKFLLLGNVWILGGGFKILMLRFLMEPRQRRASRLILSTISFSMSFRMARYIARNTTIIDVENLFLPGMPFAITMHLRFLLPFMRN
jgi:hypothetical protein